MKVTRVRVLIAGFILVLTGAVAGVGVTAALAAPAAINNAQGAARYAANALRHYRAIPNGTHYGVRCAGFYVHGQEVAGHYPVKVICHLTPRSR